MGMMVPPDTWWDCPKCGKRNDVSMINCSQCGNPAPNGLQLQGKIPTMLFAKDSNAKIDITYNIRQSSSDTSQQSQSSPLLATSKNNAGITLKIGEKRFIEISLSVSISLIVLLILFQVLHLSLPWPGQPGNNTQTGSGPITTPTAISRSAVSNTMYRGQSLTPTDDYRLSNNGTYQLKFQHDGNLVEYNLSDGDMLWSSNTANEGATIAEMQADGNFVIYNQNGAIFATNTSTNSPSTNGFKLIVEDNSNIIIYDQMNNAIWSNTGEL